MMFGEAASESPRVASPWTKARSSGSRSSNNSTPLSIRAKSSIHDSASRGEVDEEPLSTPPTEVEDGFFSLDVDLDLDRLDMGSKKYNPSVESGPHLTSQSPIKDPKVQSDRARLNRLAPEPDALGNLEYKLRLLPPTRHRYDRLLTQLKWRLLQGGGSCTYEIGVLDDGRCIGICPTEMRVSLRVLTSLASELGASVRVRRAFLLVESHQSSSQGRSNRLWPLSHGQAQSKLLDIGQQGHEAQRMGPCPCKVGEQILAWPEGKTLNNSFRTGRSTGTEFYDVDIADSHNEIIDGTWMGGSESDEGGEEVAESADEEQAFTFSLSLDEMATRQGIGSQRNTRRRRCRYRAKGAQVRRQKEACSPRLPAFQEGAGSDIKVGRLSTRSSTAKCHDELAAPPSSNEMVVIDEPFPPPAACERIIVEAVVSRSDEEDTTDFIDYSSL